MILSYKNNGGERLDKFLAGRFLNYSRGYFQKLIKSGDILVDNQTVKPRYILKAGNKIKIHFIEQKKEIDLKPADIPLEVIFENDDVIVINKQPGLVVHPAAGNRDNTLVNALIQRNPEIKSAVVDKSSKISQMRPGIVHRLDKDTSGIILIAKNQRALFLLSEQIKNRNIKKIYRALCFGWPKNDKGQIINYLGRNPKKRKEVSDIGLKKGKEAISFYRIIKCFKDSKNNKYSLIEFIIKTGRTHQIRYQSASINLPILGDVVYGSKQSINLSKSLGIKRQLLHAKEIELNLPNQKNKACFKTPLPKDFGSLIDRLDKI